jgi:hypothetical protein
VPPNRVVVRMSVTAPAACLINRPFLGRPAHALSLPDNFAPVHCDMVPSTGLSNPRSNPGGQNRILTR